MESTHKESIFLAVARCLYYHEACIGCISSKIPQMLLQRLQVKCIGYTNIYLGVSKYECIMNNLQFCTNLRMNFQFDAD